MIPPSQTRSSRRNRQVFRVSSFTHLAMVNPIKRKPCNDVHGSPRHPSRLGEHPTRDIYSYHCLSFQRPHTVTHFNFMPLVCCQTTTITKPNFALNFAITNFPASAFSRQRQSALQKGLDFLSTRFSICRVLVVARESPNPNQRL
jgi:hypothetical protein